MRVRTNVVVVLSLLVAAVAVAGAGDQKAPAPLPPQSSANPGATGAGQPPAAPAGADPSGTAAAPAPTTSSAGPASPASPASPEDTPTPVRTRRLEQRAQALKERAWQLKARVQMLKEQMLGGGVGAQSLISHSNDMGASFRLTKLAYTLDGTQIFVRTDDTGETLYKTKTFDIFTGPISPGNHTLSIAASYRGHGYGVFEYLSKFTFTAQGQTGFTAAEGRIARIECRGYEKGGPATPMEKRASIECKAVEQAPDRPVGPVGDKPADSGATPGTTPLPPPTPAPTSSPGK